MPAAAVIPAPIAYTNVVAVRKLVVGFLASVRLARGPGVLVSRFAHRPSFGRVFLPLIGLEAGS